MKSEGIFNNDSEIDFKVIFRFLKRNKFNVLSSTFLGLVFAFITQATAPKIWKGEFQIVLNLGSSQPSNSVKAGFADQLEVLGLDKSQNDLQTQVEILTSPSVLLEIFEYVKSQKSKDDITFKNTSFLDWKANLKVELIEGTSVLNLSYLDSDKNFILPVLDKISNEYTSYNMKKRTKDIEEDLNFYKAKIDDFKSRSIDSYNKAQQFAIDNDFKFDFDLDSREKSDYNVESVRVDNANTLKYLKGKLKQIEKIDAYSRDIVNFANYEKNTINFNSLLLDKINNKNEKLTELRNIYLENDNTIQNIKNERLELKIALKKDIVGSLKSEILDKEALVQAYSRPKEILLKYSALVNQARKEDATLNTLEDQIRMLSLEISRKEFPWDLITKPTLLPAPYAPYKSIFYLIGAFLGLLVGFLGSYIMDKKKDTIFDTEDLEDLFIFPILEETSIIDSNYFRKSVQFISSNPSIIPLDKIGIIYENQNDNEIEKNLIECFTTVFKDKKLIFSTDFRDLAGSIPQIILVELGVTKKSNLIYKLQKLISNEISILGFLVIK